MTKFKIGDKVKIIQRKKYNLSGVQPGWDQPNGNVGEIGYVTNIRGIYCIKRTMDSGYLGWFDEDDLELVLEENYVGRTIKALIDSPEGTNVRKGEVIKIKEITSNLSFYKITF